MKRHLTTSPLKLALSATLALALSVAPVSADNYGSRSDSQDATTVIGILLGLATVGALLSSQKNWKEDKDKPSRPHKRVRRVPDHLQLPANCLRTYRTQQGKQKFFAPRCLKRNFSYASDLPRACRDTIVARNKNGIYVARKVYRSGCLNNRGYRTKTTY
ncbi:hypothetical protein SAMN05444851_0220 [Aliiroseovarius sediminilitoris]|uniref:Uncharacterized protein n=1 Tax=Aliiroseovarius sediminilitoris TaxID=1173584 RepID=A0A1I0MPC2_9RHOB|nr:hypothetical protein [Aliiroseovarius sediminilitoris]SEV90395.1 hypothetical protein SAMN05444851_0220 [Aliiroseovarius sediminilitoris]